MRKTLIILIALITSVSSYAASYTWVGGTSTDWNTAANWSPSSGVPSSGDNVTFSNGSATHMPLLDMARSVTNITMSAGTLDLNTYTLTITGTTSLTGGTINNGTAAFSNATTTFSGTTFGAFVTVSAASLSFNGSIFNKKVIASKTGSANNTSSGGNTFNDTLDLSISNGFMHIAYTSNDSYNGLIFLSSTGSSQGITFGGNTGATTLASGKTIAVGSGGFSIGTLTLNRFTQTGSTPQTLTLTSAGQIVFGTNSTWNGRLTVTAPSLAFSGSTFNSKVTATKNGNSTTTSAGGNAFNDTLDLSISIGFLYMTYTNNDAFNAPVYVSSTGTSQGIGFGSNTGYGTLASGKTISIGTGGFSVGTLSLFKFTQTGTTPQSFTLTGTGQITFGTLSTWNGPVSITSPNIAFSGTTFNKKVTAIKNGGVTNTSLGGNTFNDTLDISISASLMYMHNASNDAYNSHVFISSTGTSQGVAFGANTASGTLASGKTLSIGSGGFSVGTLTLTRFTQTGTTAQTLSLTGTAQVTFGTNSTWNGPLSITTPNIAFSGTTFNDKVVLTKTGGVGNTSAGGNTFNDSLKMSLSTGLIYMTYTNNDAFNGHVVINSTGTSQGVLFGENGGSSTLASGKTLTIGSGGFSIGTLQLKRFTQSGSTAQSITLTSSATLLISTTCTFNGNLTVSAPNVFVTGSTFNGSLTVTKTSSSTNTWSGANTYNGAVSVTNTGTGYINLSYVASGGDVYYGNATFTKSSTGDVLIVGNASTVTFKGDITMSGISSTQFTSGQLALFNGTTNQTLSNSTTISFGNVTVNKASDTLKLSSPLAISGVLTLTSGKILSTSTNIVNFGTSASVSSASNSSYIQGPASKTGSAAFTFPIGKGGYYRPIGISTPVSGSSSATVFTAEYKNTNQTQGSSADTSIANISDCEHWIFTRSGSSATVNITLSWNSASCNGAVAANMRVIGWNGSTWTNYGNGSRTGYMGAGTVTSNTTPTAYNAFALSNRTCTATAAITPGGATSFCNGGSVTLTATANAKKYSWSNSATTQAITVNTSATYTIALRDTSGCNGSANQAVTVWTKPIAHAGTDNAVCSGLGVTIGDSPAATSGTSPYSYSWYPSTALTNSAIANPTANPTATTNYILTVTDANSCTAKDTMHLTIHPALTINGGGEKIICIGSSTTIGASPTIIGGTFPYTIAWLPTDSLDDDAIANPTANPAVTTTYAISVTDVNGCTGDSSAKVIVNALQKPPIKPVKALDWLTVD